LCSYVFVLKWFTYFIENFYIKLLSEYAVFLLGMDVSEVKNLDIPIPLINYVNLIKQKKSPYYEIVKYLLRDMEIRYRRAGVSEVVYTINPRQLQKEIEDRIRSEKVTTINICRTVLALLYGSNLRREDDFYVTTSSRGRRNYHIRVTQQTLMNLYRFL